MKKTKPILIAFLLFTALLTACDSGGIINEKEIRNSANSGEFNTGDFLPLNGNLNLEISFDIENDDISEKAIYYSDFETVGESDYLYNREHVEVYKLKADGWVKEYSFDYPKTNIKEYEADEEGVIYIREDEIPDIKQGILEVSGVDIALDGREELIIIRPETDSENPGVGEYKIIGDMGEGITEYKIPNTLEKIPLGTQAQKLNVNFYDGKIIEHWGILCEGAKGPCIYFDFELNLDPITKTWQVSEALNIEKNEPAYSEHLEYLKQKNEESEPWDGTLPF